jgi:hypothetical protein
MLGKVACMVQNRNAYKVFVRGAERKKERKKSLGR